MIFEKLFNQSRILEVAMQATQYKNQVILNNISNSDTPGYKSKTVNFESTLSKAIDDSKKFGIDELNKVMPNLTVSEKKHATSLDGNSNDVETEMMEFYKNSSKYDVIVNSVVSNSNITSSIYTTFK